MGALILHVSNAFHMIYYSILTTKLATFGVSDAAEDMRAIQLVCPSR